MAKITEETIGKVIEKLKELESKYKGEYEETKKNIHDLYKRLRDAYREFLKGKIQKIAEKFGKEELKLIRRYLIPLNNQRSRDQMPKDFLNKYLVQKSKVTFKRKDDLVGSINEIKKNYAEIKGSKDSKSGMGISKYHFLLDKNSAFCIDCRIKNFLKDCGIKEGVLQGSHTPSP